MANQREIFKSFDDNLTSLSIDDSFAVAGLFNGSVACIFLKNKIIKFTTQLAEVAITAVLADNFDVKGKSLFYAGDMYGNLYVLDDRGDIVDTLKVGESPIFAIRDVEARKVWVYLDEGRAVVELQNDKLVQLSKKESKFSQSLDGEFYRRREKGEFSLEEFEATVPSRVYGTPSIMVEKSGDNIDVVAFTTDSERFRRELVEDKKASSSLTVMGRGYSKLRTIEFDAPVKQVINCLFRVNKAKKDALYVLTCDDKIYRFKTSEVADVNIDSDSLTKVLVFDDEQEEIDDLGDIESMTVRGEDVLFIMRESDEMFIVKDTE